MLWGFVLKMVLVTRGSFSYRWAALNTQSGSFLLLTQPVSRCTRSWEGTQLGQMTPTDQRNVLNHMMSCLAIRSQWAEGGKERVFWVMAFVFPIDMWWSFSGVGWTLAYWWEAVNTALFAVALAIKLFLCQPTDFSLLPVWFSPSSRCGDDEWTVVLHLAPGWA